MVAGCHKEPRRLVRKQPDWPAPTEQQLAVRHCVAVLISGRFNFAGNKAKLNTQKKSPPRLQADMAATSVTWAVAMKRAWHERHFPAIKEPMFYYGHFRRQKI